jgi:hypothetical protein
MTTFDFENADKGFESRGTALAGKIFAIRRIDAAIRSCDDFEDEDWSSGALRPFCDRLTLGNSWVRRLDEAHFSSSMQQRALISSEYCLERHAYAVFWGESFPAYAVFESTSSDPNGLLNLASIKSMCDIGDKIALPDDEACAVLSLGEVIAALLQTTCSALTSADIDATREVLTTWAPFYFEGTIKTCMEEMTTDTKSACYMLPGVVAANLDEEAIRVYAVYLGFRLLLDERFLNPSFGSPPALQYAQVVAKQWDRAKERHDLLSESVGVDVNGAKLVAYKSEDYKFELFNIQLMLDSALGFLAMVLVAMIMWVHTGHGTLTALAMFQIIFNIPVSLFFYTCILQMPFFPFLNMVVLFIIVGVGADDVFVYVDAWKQSFFFMPPSCTLAERVEWTLKRAGGAMAVTTATTAVAFFANALSPITSIRCFGIFAGIVIAVDYAMMVSWLPCLVVLFMPAGRMKACSRLCSTCALPSGDQASDEQTLASSPPAAPASPLRTTADATTARSQGVVLRPAEVFFRDSFSVIVTDKRAVAVWVVVCTILGIFGSLWTLDSPRLRFPRSQEFQLFILDRDNAEGNAGYGMEAYDQLYRDKFASDSEGTMDVSIWWGPRPVDNGNAFDPMDRGSLEWDQFDIMGPDAQSWLLRLCDSATEQPFISETQLCFVQDIKEHGISSCLSEDLPSAFSNAGCCGQAVFPFTSGQFAACTMAWINSDRQHDSWNGQLFFDADAVLSSATLSANLRAMRFRFKPTHPGTNVYDKVDTFYKQVNGWAEEQLATAPAETGLGAGFFLGNPGRIEFYELRTSLDFGAYSAMGFSLLFSSVVLAVSNGNAIITISALLSIFFILMLTVGVLIQVGWVLGVTESVVMSVAAGMAVDFTVHYGHAYANGSHGKHGRLERLVGALTEMGVVRQCHTCHVLLVRIFTLSLSFCVCCMLRAQSISMGAITTFVAGLVLLASTVHFFFNFGVFLSLCMFLSWTYSSLYYLSILSLIGPEGTEVNQLNWMLAKSKGTQGPEGTTGKEKVVPATPANGVALRPSPSA